MVPVDSLDLMLKSIGRSSLSSTPTTDLVKMLELIRDNPETAQIIFSSYSLSRFFVRPHVDLKSLEDMISEELLKREDSTNKTCAGEEVAFSSASLAEMEENISCPDCDELVSPVTSIFELEDMVNNGGETAVDPVESLEDIEIQIDEDFCQDSN